MKSRILIFIILGLSQIVHSQNFTEVSVAKGIDHLHVSANYIGGGCAFFDFDNDGFLDIYLTGGQQQDALYKNLGNGLFTEVTNTAGFAITSSIYTSGVVTGDINNDGFRDVFITTTAAHGNLMFLNNGNGTFTNISSTANLESDAINEFSISASFGDINLDGYLDLYVANYVQSTGFLFDSVGTINGFKHHCYPNKLFLNNGDNTFTDVSDDYQVSDTGCALATSFTDFDQDNDMDIHIANDFGAFVVPDQMYKNNFPNQSFDNVSSSININSGIYGMGIAVGDYDEDLDFDYYISNLGRNVLHQNQGDNTFTDVTDSAGVTNTTETGLLVTSWGNGFVDYNNNSLLDLVVSNGHIPAAQFIATVYDDPNKLYQNNGNGTFTDISTATGIDNTWINRGLAHGDYDNDGDMDLLFATIYPGNIQPFHTLLYRNESDSLFSSNNYVQFELKCFSGNRDAFGSRVLLYTGGRTFLQEVDGGSSHASQHSSIVHFGLETISSIDSAVVIWPGGDQQTAINIPINQRSIITQDASLICEKVTGLNTSAIKENSARLNWTDSGGFGYEIRGKEQNANVWFTALIPAGNTSKTFNGLQPETNYVWQIRRICEVSGKKLSWWSSPVTFTTTCLPPANIWTDQITATSARFNWTAKSNASAYRIIGKPITSSKTNSFVVAPFLTNFTAYGLQPNTTYVWGIKNLCLPLKSKISIIDTFTTLPSKISSLDNPLQTREIYVFPNPNQGNFQISFSELDKNKILSIQLFNMEGKLANYQIERVEEENTYYINTFNSAAGIYNIAITTVHGIENKRILINY